MSRQLISRSGDLSQLRAEGYDIEIRQGHLLVKSVPYVDSNQQIRRGELVLPLGDVSGDTTRPPGNHTAHFAGKHPCDRNGEPLSQIQHSTEEKALAKGVVVNHMFSAKPRQNGQYRDYHHKATTYIAHISAPALGLDPTVTAQTNATTIPGEDESPFQYSDSASARAGICALSARLEGQRLAILGVGGTGSYVLDFVAKTPVAEIHLYDEDVLLNHNAFRSPGAPSLDELRKIPTKAAFFRDKYVRMHRGVVAHEEFLNEGNVDELRKMDFVFLCIDGGGGKLAIVGQLEAWGISFIDVGMGVELAEDGLRGIVRATTSTAEKRDHYRSRVSMADGGAENEYASNIQIAELNALNAALAVIKWKKLAGFYQDLDREHCCMYTINGNTIANEDRT